MLSSVVIATNLITLYDLAYAITIIKNHESVWEQDHFKETLEEDEQNKYDNYKELDRPEERKKYSPKIPRFSAGIGVQRTFGSVIWNKDWMIFYESTNKIWKATYKDEAV